MSGWRLEKYMTNRDNGSMCYSRIHCLCANLSVWNSLAKNVREMYQRIFRCMTQFMLMLYHEQYYKARNKVWHTCDTFEGEKNEGS